MKWYQPACIGDRPSKRSGHTLTAAKNSFVYLIGGCVHTGKTLHRSENALTNDVYKGDFSSESEAFWTKIESTEENDSPIGRWQHTSTYINNEEILVFGGFGNSKSTSHLNDTWIFDIKTEKWKCVSLPRDKHFIPDPRGAHSASLLENKVYVFGGYGGYGYSRRDFNDLNVLDIKSWTWTKVDTSSCPSPRSGHQSIVMDGKLFVLGGWNASEQFSDVHCLNFDTMSWDRIDDICGSSWGPSRWNFTAISVKAVPKSKAFIFGGNSGDYGSNSLQGHFLNDLIVLENSNDVFSWTKPTVVGTTPIPRASTQMVYQPETSRLILFGGWAKKWLDDIHACKVDEVVGPPYFISSVHALEWNSAIGPVTGNTPMLIRGKGFLSSPGDKAIIRLATLNGFVEVDGQVDNDEEVSFCTPAHGDSKNLETEIRIKLGSKSFTNSTASFTYFSVSDCSQSVAFGPGLLQGNCPGAKTMFIIQARDSNGFNRTCGMDKYQVIIKSCGTKEDVNDIPTSITDHNDGTYAISFVLPHIGMFEVRIFFQGTFSGKAGEIRGSPFRTTAVEEAQACANLMNGPSMINDIKSSIVMMRQFCSTTKKGLEKTLKDDDLKGLVVIKGHVAKVNEKKDDFLLSIDKNKSALSYLKTRMKIPTIDKDIKDLEKVISAWKEVKQLSSDTIKRISSISAIWRERVKRKIENYEIALCKKEEEFKKMAFWMTINSKGEKMDKESAMKSIEDAQRVVRSEGLCLGENSHLCKTFELNGNIDNSTSIVNRMTNYLHEAVTMWNINGEIKENIETCCRGLWSDVDCDDLETLGKKLFKSVKSVDASVRWSDAFKSLEKSSKNFITVIPLVLLLKDKCMRRRHWEMLIKATGGTISIPCEDSSTLLGDVLSLNLHQYVNEVEEICDQASKEEKMEKILSQIFQRWSSIEFTMTPFKRIDGENIPLLSITEEDFEALENDQLLIQGMLASRFLPQFENEVKQWNRSLNNVNETLLLTSEIQRTWSYLEPLFMHSDEVKKELPEDATRFADIDINVRKCLVNAYEIRNVNKAFNVSGLFKKLEAMQHLLELCKKSLADFLDGRRRQFPRYYFVSEADLLDILSNGSTPEKILQHIPKVYLSTKTLTFGTEKSSTGRPIATDFVAGVGDEVCSFEPPVSLEGKVEIYMQTVLDTQKRSIFETVKRSLARYPTMDRPNWLLTKDPKNGRPLDPAQTTLLVLGINYVEDVEKAFCEISSGNRNALDVYNRKQKEQLNDLIRLTQSNLSKGDRTRVMVSITMDAHGRDIVQKMIRNKVDSVDSFMWQSQLKHKFRVSPAHARYLYRDPELRGVNKERAEIAICDAVLPYDYEYLGNGPRLVITPLTDRIYVTATQALNLKMGCAPAGPAGTGKTETTKDLANALAKLIYVINCKCCNSLVHKELTVLTLSFKVLPRWIIKA